MIEFLSHVPGEYVLIAVSLIMFVESGSLVGIFVPGSGTVLALGFLAAQHLVAVWPSVAAVAVASALGAQHGYYQGRRGWLSRRAVERLGEVRAAQLQSSLDRRAGLTVAVAQCIGVARTLSPRLAGQMGISYRRFALGTVPVALAWSTVLVLLGNSAGSAYRQVEALVGLFGLPVLVVALLVVRWWRRRASRTRVVTGEDRETQSSPAGIRSGRRDSP